MIFVDRCGYQPISEAASRLLNLQPVWRPLIMPDIETLREEWKTLYSTTLPQMAKSRDLAQVKWPVTLDHCFARIILDHTIGEGHQQWDKVLPKPAIKNMSAQQLQNAITLGRKVEAGEVDLCHLDEKSLQCRGKNKAKHHKATVNESRQQSEEPNSVGASRKRSSDEADGHGSAVAKKARKGETQLTLDSWGPKTSTPTSMTKQQNREEVKHILQQIQSHPSLTPYRKRLYTTLLSVPRGRFTTYAAMSAYLNSSARAVGNGMRNNPFAPQVPCHRVLAADGSIGGFYGDWGKDGKHASKKVELLRSEGVRFNGSGKVVGEPFRKFHTFEQLEDDDSA